MTKLLRYPVILCLLLVSLPGCNSRPPAQPARSGSLQFWHSGAPSYSVTTVAIGEMFRQITRDIPEEPPCGALGCASFVLPAGNYTYRAREEFPGRHTWTGSVQVKSSTCINIRLN